jgi:hypothetical protein
MIDKKDEIRLLEAVGAYAMDPYGFVLFAFPWGEKDGPLEKFADGPDAWQTEVLKEMGAALRDGHLTTTEVIRQAVSAGNGVGKSALVAWIILWAMATFEDCRGVVTANTENQLRTKTWAELSKWARMSIVADWFNVTATAIYSSKQEHEKTWRIDQIPWSENKPEAFAGLHNQGRRVILIFDEASAIPDIIWETAEGAMTDENTQIIWAAFGNPTRNSGRFHACFNGQRHRWHNRHVDSRTCRFTNKNQIKTWVEDYGEDSDFVRIHVRGVFPHASSKQFIPGDIVEMARGKHLREEQYNFAPVIIGVDPAWQGGDEFVIALRQGLMSKVLARYQKNDNDVEMAGFVAKFEDQYKADAVFIDLGWGTGIYSAGKQMGRKWQLVAFGGKSSNEGLLNKRAEMWNNMKEWLQSGGAIPNDPVLCSDLTGVEARTGELGPNCGKTYLEPKESMRARGLASPGSADALALTFAFPVRSKVQRGFQAQMDYAQPYDPLSLNIRDSSRRFDPLALTIGQLN